MDGVNSMDAMLLFDCFGRVLRVVGGSAKGRSLQPRRINDAKGGKRTGQVQRVARNVLEKQTFMVASACP